MTSAVPQEPVAADGDPFDLTRPSPLPDVPPRDPAAHDPVAEAERSAARAESASEPPVARAQAWLTVSDAWLALDAVGPALDAARRALGAAPEHTDALDAVATLASRAGLHREAAEAREALARVHDAPAAWQAAVRAWLRADAPGDAERCLAEVLRRAGDDPKVRALELSVLRLRGAPSEALVPRLLDAAARARKHDDREGWRVHSADAWLESRGAEGGETLAEALAASGHPRAAVYVAAEAAARAMVGDGPDAARAARLLVRCARLAENAALPGEATAAWAVRALLGDAQARDARESLRDLLAERGRAGELAARLRADARRAPPGARAAAWKGVAAIEIPQQPARAAHALAQALRLQPDDPEATELLDALAADPAAEGAVRDALWGVAGTQGLEPGARARWMRWLGELEERAGDTASAATAYAAAGAAGADGLARVAEAAATLVARADQGIAALESADPEVAPAAEHLLAALGKHPGAFRDARAVARVLGPLALHDDRIAGLWVRIARRADDPGQVVAVLRRLATRCTAPGARVAAAVECAEALDAAEGPAAAAELLTQLLDEVPEEPSAAAALAALAEHGGDAVLARDALRAVARAASDPWERDLLARFTGSPHGIFAVFASCLAEPTASRDRTANLARLHDLLGDCTSLLAGRTRALLAQTGPLEEGVDVARRFAAFDPASPEATIAWFGAASLAGDPAQLGAAAAAVAGSLAGARDVAAVARTALTRLGALGADSAVRDLALAVTRAGGLGDRALRAAVAQLADGPGDPATGLRLLEAVAAGAHDALAEREAALRRVAARYRLGAHTVGELRALDRVLALAPADGTVFSRLLDLASRTGDGAVAARVLESRLAAVTAPAERRGLHLALAATLAAAVPARTDEAVAALDRYAAEARSDTAQGETARALVALGRADAAVERLARWSDETLSDTDAAARALAAARLANDALRDPMRALRVLRTVLGRAADHPEVLLTAERIAVEAGARAAMLAIYDDLAVTAAGEHGRHALAYRRAAFMERCGDHEGALAEHLALFEKYPSLGASFSAIERIVETTGRYDALARCLGLLAAASPASETRGRFYLRAAEVARTRGRDLRAAAGYEIQALRAAPDPTTEALVIEHGRLLRGSDPAGAQSVFESLTDDILAAGNQAWDDDARRAFALRAAEIAAVEAADPYRLAAAVALYFRGHDDPAAGREAITALLNRAAAAPSLRDAAESVPAMAAAHRAAEVTFTAASETPTSPGPVPAVPAPVPVVTVTAPTLAVTATEPRTVTAADSTAATAAGRSTGVRPRLELVVNETPAPPPRVPLPPGARAERPTAEPPTAEPPATEPPTAEPERVSHVEVLRAPLAQLPAAALRDAAAQGNDAAAATLAERLAASEDALDEALAIQRRRFSDDPSRLDALAAMVGLYQATQMPAEAMALDTVLAVLAGRAAPTEPPRLQDLVEPLEGVARMLAPSGSAPFAELGALLWEARGTSWRREADRTTRESERPRVDPASDAARMFAAAVRLLQLPRATQLILREDVPGGAAVVPTHPAAVALGAGLARDTARARYLLGRALEGTRTGHVLATTLGADDGARLVAAVQAAFGELPSGARLDAAVARMANDLLDGIAPRSQRRVRELLDELGSRFAWEPWVEAVDIARTHAGMLLSGDFGVAAVELLAAHPSADPDPRRAIRTHEPLRELTRFATSKDYLLLRWQVDEAARRRR